MNKVEDLLNLPREVIQQITWWRRLMDMEVKYSRIAPTFCNDGAITATRPCCHAWYYRDEGSDSDDEEGLSHRFNNIKGYRTRYIEYYTCGDVTQVQSGVERWRGFIGPLLHL